jgi:hypothetical protein
MKTFFGTVMFTFVWLALSMPSADAGGRRNIGSSVDPGLMAIDNVDVTIENYSNQSCFVAVSYRGGKTYNQRFAIVTWGWREVKPNDRLTFHFRTAYDAYLRVEDSNGGEYSWDGLNQYGFSYVTDSGFKVFKPLDDTSVRILRAGQTTTNILKGTNPPAGWETTRFFRVGSAPLLLQIQP